LYLQFLLSNLYFQDATHLLMCPRITGRAIYGHPDKGLPQNSDMYSLPTSTWAMFQECLLMRNMCRIPFVIYILTHHGS